MPSQGASPATTRSGRAARGEKLSTEPESRRGSLGQLLGDVKCRTQCRKFVRRLSALAVASSSRVTVLRVGLRSATSFHSSVGDLRSTL